MLKAFRLFTQGVLYGIVAVGGVLFLSIRELAKCIDQFM
jgi:hypothetical protein